MRLANVVMREDDGRFMVRPFEEAVRLNVESYVLTPEQLSVFEAWFIRENELDISFCRKTLKRPGWFFLISGLILALPVVPALAFPGAVAHLLGGSLGLVETAFQLGLVFFVLAGVFTVLENRKKRRRMRVSFPFPNAPRVVWTETEMVRWFEWERALEPQGNIAVWLSSGFALVFCLGAVVTWAVPDLFGHPMNESAPLAFIWASAFFLLVVLVFLRRRFKAGRAFEVEYGKTRKPKNQYLKILKIEKIRNN